MSHFGEVLREIREKRSLTVNQLGIYAKVSPALISKIENGKRGVPKPETIAKLAEALKMPYDELMEKAGHLTALSSYGLEPYNPVNMDRLPILGTVRAGEPILMNDNIESYMDIESDVLKGKKGFILRVNGDSMSGDGIFNGDLAIIELTNEAEPNQIVVVGIDNQEACLKRVECLDGICTLSSSNPAYKPMMYRAEMINIIGVVVETRRRYK